MFAALILNGANFGDHVSVATSSRRLKIKYAKRNFVKGGAEIIKRLLKHIDEYSEQVFDSGDPSAAGFESL